MEAAQGILGPQVPQTIQSCREKGCEEAVAQKDRFYKITQRDTNEERILKLFWRKKNISLRVKT